MDWTDRLLILFAAAYLALIAVGVSGDSLHSSADRVSHGDLWLLLTSALNMVPELDVAQWFLITAATSLVIFRHGPKLWWTVALTGHIGAALISYAIIGAAIWLGSGSADEAASQADYGISIVLAATVGAIAASGFSVPSRQRDRADRACVWLGLIGLAGMIAFSVGWYDMQHVIGFAIGFVLAGWLIDRQAFNWVRPLSDRDDK